MTVVSQAIRCHFLHEDCIGGPTITSLLNYFSFLRRCCVSKGDIQGKECTDFAKSVEGLYRIMNKLPEVFCETEHYICVESVLNKSKDLSFKEELLLFKEDFTSLIKAFTFLLKGRKMTPITQELIDAKRIEKDWYIEFRDSTEQLRCDHDSIYSFERIEHELKEKTLKMCKELEEEIRELKRRICDIEQLRYDIEEQVLEERIHFSGVSPYTLRFRCPPGVNMDNMWWNIYLEPDTVRKCIEKYDREVEMEFCTKKKYLGFLNPKGQTVSGRVVFLCQRKCLVKQWREEKQKECFELNSIMEDKIRDEETLFALRNPKKKDLERFYISMDIDKMQRIQVFQEGLKRIFTKKVFGETLDKFMDACKPIAEFFYKTRNIWLNDVSMYDFLKEMEKPQEINTHVDVATLFHDVMFLEEKIKCFFPTIAGFFPDEN